MAYVNSTFLARWRAAWSRGGLQGGEPRGLVGQSKPVLQALVRKGHFSRAYGTWTDNGSGDMTNIIIPGEPQTGSGHWMATWVPTSDWQELPQVASADLEQSFEENGINRLTLVINNTVAEQHSGIAGIYRLFRRGWFSPFRGYTRAGLPDHFAQVPDWYQLLNSNAEVVVLAGFGEDTMVPVFKGLTDDVMPAAAPAKLTVTLRDFGQVLVEETLFLDAKSPQIPDPLVFADRFRADNVHVAGTIGPSDASSYLDSHPPRLANDNPYDPADQSAWWSTAHSTDGTLEWLQCRVPEGRYETCYIAPAVAGYDIYIGIYAKPRVSGPAQMDYVDIPEGWVDTGNLTAGGPNAGWPYTKKLTSFPYAASVPKLGGIFELGAGSIIRIGIRNLQEVPAGGNLRAAIREFHGLRRTRKVEAIQKKWILVDDVSEIVMVLLRWAGFKEWIVERTGVRIDFEKNFIVNRGDHFVDVIKKVVDQTGFVFFMGDPSNQASIGIPTFRSSSVLREDNAPDYLTGLPRPVQTVKDTELLTGIEAKLTDEPLARDIYVRGGRQSKRGQGGVSLGGDTSLRFQFRYSPPWQSRLAGILKRAVHYDNNLKSKAECQIACYLIAMAEALASATAVLQIPANPSLELDDKVYLVDESTGFVSRLWIANRGWSFETGENAHFTMSLGGALVDTPDIVAIKQAIENARAAGLKLPPVAPSTVVQGP